MAQWFQGDIMVLVSEGGSGVDEKGRKGRSGRRKREKRIQLKGGERVFYDGL